MRQLFLICSFLTGIFLFPVSNAMLDLELTQGVAAAIPIAIVPFKGPGIKAPGDESVGQVIKNDLQNSGEFRVVNGSSLGKTTASSVNTENWRKRGVDYVIGVSVVPAGNQYRVSFQLLSVYKGVSTNKADTQPTSSVLVDQAFDATASALRTVSHHISDLVYKKLIGVRGIFSTKIAYILVQHTQGKPARYRLKVADVDGYNPETLLASNEPIMSPAWTPDGKKLAYVSFEGHHASVFIQNLSSGKRESISAAPGINGAPTFSQDGKFLALVLTKTANPKIYVMNLENKTSREITYGWSIDTEPAFSPDGKDLLFTSNRDGQPQIYKYSLSNSTISRISYAGNYNARASFFPDGKSIVMMHRENGLFGIARQNLATGQLQILVQTGDDESPSLSPNGKMVIYATEYGGRGVLAQVSTDGRIKLRLPAQDGTVQEPAWSPFL
jgi:TolB protein